MSSIRINTLSAKVQNAVQSGVIKITESKDGNYTVWKYDRDMVTQDDLELGAYRSLVFSSISGKLLCYAPEKSLPKQLFFDEGLSECFRRGLSPEDPENKLDLCLTETVEGTMINLFWNPDIEQWEIATRSGVGGHYWYTRTCYGSPGETTKKQKTFRQMFIECLNGDPDNLSMDAIPGIDYLSRDYCYSFVIQHPDNHFVYRIHRPTATLVAVYRREAGNEVAGNEVADNEVAGNEVADNEVAGNEVAGNEVAGNEVHVIRWIDYSTVCEHTGQLIYAQSAAAIGCISVEVKELETYDMEESSWFSHYYPMGYMVVNRTTGQRYSIENPHYKKVKELRGNHANIQFQYLALNRAGKVTEFLSYFPQYKKQFFKFYKQYHEFVTEVHNAYVSYYVQKNRDLVPKKYFVHASKIHHNVYLPSIANEQKTIITHRVVREYFDSLSPSSQIYYLNLE